jgi:hypothetical protein
MTLTPKLQKMFEEKTKKLSNEFHQKNCCDEEINDFESIKECLNRAKKYINHLQDYYFPMIEKNKNSGLYGMWENLRVKQNEYLQTCHEFSEIVDDVDVVALAECLKKACDYINEFESDLKELGFQLQY